jgi:hypothetical protein
MRCAGLIPCLLSSDKAVVDTMPPEGLPDVEVDQVVAVSREVDPISEFRKV